MAVVSYLSPKKDNMFSKWFKIYISTYIDIFIRVGIIYFCVFLSAQLLDTIESGETTFWASIGQEDLTTRSYIVVIMILALLTFAKKAPELLKELLPTSASKLGFGTSMKEIFGLGATVGGIAGLGISTIGRVSGAAKNIGHSAAVGYNNFKNANGIRGKFGAAAGGIFRTAGSALGGVMSVGTGAVSGTVRGMQAGHGAKGQMLSAARAGQQAAAKANTERAQRITSGSTRRDRAKDAVVGFFGGQNSYEQLNARNSSYSELKSEIDGDDRVKNAQTAYNAKLSQYIENTPGGTAATFASSPDGVNYSQYIKDAQEAAYADKIASDEVFQTKVSVHNKRF